MKHSGFVRCNLTRRLKVRAVEGPKSMIMVAMDPPNVVQASQLLRAIWLLDGRLEVEYSTTLATPPRTAGVPAPDSVTEDGTLPSSASPPSALPTLSHAMQTNRPRNGAVMPGMPWSQTKFDPKSRICPPGHMCLDDAVPHHSRVHDDDRSREDVRAAMQDLEREGVIHNFQANTSPTVIKCNLTSQTMLLYDPSRLHMVALASSEAEVERLKRAKEVLGDRLQVLLGAHGDED